MLLGQSIAPPHGTHLKKIETAIITYICQNSVSSPKKYHEVQDYKIETADYASDFRYMLFQDKTQERY